MLCACEQKQVCRKKIVFDFEPSSSFSTMRKKPINFAKENEFIMTCACAYKF